MKEISEPVYEGFISVEEDELPILETETVQRLRRIHQLGLSKAVYPGASHTRFEHSIGVMHLAGQLAESVALPDEDRKTYRLAGLLHDVGHPPYSHSLEPIMEERLGISHEDQTCKMIDEMEAEFPVSRERVKDAIQGRSQYGIVAGPVDADRMDYLNRDALETGVPHGKVDTTSIIEFASTYEGNLAFDKHAVPALEGLFTSRLHMTKSVYAHHTARILELMLQRAVENLLDTTGTNVREVMRWDDYELHTRLLDSEGVSRHLFKKIAERDPYKRALYLDEDDIGRDGLRSVTEMGLDPHQIEREIASRAEVQPIDVLVDLPQLPPVADYDVTIIDGDTATTLSSLSDLPATVDDAEWRHTTLGVYTPEQHVEDVSEASKEVLPLL